MRVIKQTLVPMVSWLGCLLFAFATLSELRSYSRNEPGVLARGAQSLRNSSMAARAAYDPGVDLRHVSRR